MLVNFFKKDSNIQVVFDCESNSENRDIEKFGKGAFVGKVKVGYKVGHKYLSMTISKEI